MRQNPELMYRFPLVQEHQGEGTEELLASRTYCIIFTQNCLG